MQSLLTHIPIVVIQNIGLMAFLYLMFLLIKQFATTTSAQLFQWALLFYFAGALHFIFTLYYLASTHAQLHDANQTSYFDLHFSVSLDYLPVLGIAYFVIFSIYIVKMFLGYFQVNQFRSTLKTTIQNEEWDTLLVKNNMAHVSIVVSNDINLPMTLGWWEPIILIPMSLHSTLSPIALKYIILHELAHIIRNDFIIHFFIEIFHAALFFNPFSYLFKKEIQLSREMACDEWVIEHTQEPIEYSKLLYQMASLQLVAVPSNTMKLLDNQNDLLSRIKQINKIPNQSFKNWIIKSLVAMGSIFIVLLSLFVPTEKNHHNNKDVIVVNTTLPNSNMESIPTIHLQAPMNIAKLSKKKSIQVVTQREEIVLSNKQESAYNDVVNETLHWLQSRASNKQFANYQLGEDSVALHIAEKLVISSALTNYQLKKEILNRKLQNITDEKEASDILTNSKEWNDIKQYEEWAKIYLAKHPEARISDSLYNKF